METEIWKDIDGYKGKYQVSNLGRVKSLERTRQCRTKDGLLTMKIPQRLLKQWKRSQYFLVDLWQDSKRDVRSVHALVYEAFIGKIEPGNYIHHIDRNKENNFWGNLEQLSMKKHNEIHHKGHIPWNKGMKMNPESHKKQWETRHAKYNYAERNQSIIEDKKNGSSLKELSQKYNLSSRQILTICKKGY